MSARHVDSLARGGVWSAGVAINHGLVDAIGSLDDAIDSAALLADVGAYEVLYLEKTLSSKEKLLNEILNSSLQLIHRVTGGREMFGLTTLTAASTEVKELLRMTRSPGIYSRCLDCRVTD
jgi:protease-4